MSAARATAARLRGCFIGAFSAASAVGAHGLGEGGLPHSATVVVLVLACAGVGAVASSPSRTSALPIVALYLCMGQVIGHSVLTLAPWHTRRRLVADDGAGAFIGRRRRRRADLRR